MDPNLHNQQSGMNSGLTRYRSAPSSYFSDLINSGLYGDDDTDPFFNSRVSNAETDPIMSQFGGFEKQLMDSVKQEVYSDSQSQQQQQPVVYQNQTQFQPQSDHNNNINTNNNNINNNLLRQSSSPAGFFSHLDLDNGYPVMRSMDDFGPRAGNITKRLKNDAGFSSGLLPRIPENEAKVMEMKGELNDGGFGSSSWDDSDILSDSFLKEFGESDHSKLSSLNSSENQHNDVARIRPPTSLVHHLSLPARTAELDKLMQFQDTVPLRSRAKRGCATHPRSIAERVRRTRISERMRKLQELVPNMDKQTNTADMLDLAVDYIKELKKEAQTLTENHAKCTCAHKQKL
ncbi:transcription factor bHLH130-like isoform X1 [Bidens hawaiensis]|uniref:transcription factor bHLH130-like isoform X1 n=1 Tax=Bidens hawaiensis TaxID=980011 RepID=UPI0040492471